MQLIKKWKWVSASVSVKLSWPRILLCLEAQEKWVCISCSRSPSRPCSTTRPISMSEETCSFACWESLTRQHGFFCSFFFFSRRLSFFLTEGNQKHPAAQWGWRWKAKPTRTMTGVSVCFDQSHGRKSNNCDELDSKIVNFNICFLSGEHQPLLQFFWISETGCAILDWDASEFSLARTEQTFEQYINQHYEEYSSE